MQSTIEKLAWYETTSRSMSSNFITTLPGIEFRVVILPGPYFTLL
jgi:hypothetical protein